MRVESRVGPRSWLDEEGCSFLDIWRDGRRHRPDYGTRSVVHHGLLGKTSGRCRYVDVGRGRTHRPDDPVSKFIPEFANQQVASANDLSKEVVEKESKKEWRKNTVDQGIGKKDGRWDDDYKGKRKVSKQRSTSHPSTHQ